MSTNLSKNQFVTGGTSAVKPPAAAKEVSPIYRIQSLDEYEPFLRLYTWGTSGSGKTFLLALLIEAGYRVLVLNSDVGGPGLNTAIVYLRQRGKAHLMKNVKVVPVVDYKSVERFLENPAAYYNGATGGQDIWDFNPEIIAWEGFGNFQQVHVWNHVADLTGGKKTKEGDLDGLALGTLDYQLVMTATHQCIDSFCRIQSPRTGRYPHKIWQAHVDEGLLDMEGQKVSQEKAKDQETQRSQRPWIMGKSAKLVLGAADYGFRTFTKEIRVPGKQPRTSYGWDFSNSERNGGKQRDGLSPLTGSPIIMDVEPLKVWNEMLGKLGIEPKEPV